MSQIIKPNPALLEVKAGDVVRRLVADKLFAEMNVESVDDKFIYCDKMRAPGDGSWMAILGEGQERWKFDRKYGVETDEDQRWGVEFGIVLSWIEPL